MRCYGVLGRRGEALALYQRCRRVFRAQLGVEPSPDMQSAASDVRETAAKRPAPDR